MNPRVKKVLSWIIGILLVWTLLTLWAQFSGKQKIQIINGTFPDKKALIVYNPDPIYNLDEQVCKSFAQGLSNYGFSSKVGTVKKVRDEKEDYDLYVFCANTYNWAPDWAIVRFIKKYSNIADKNVVSISLGSGSTARAKRKLEKVIKEKKAILLNSKTYWLLRPNDESRMDEKNVEVAKDMAEAFGGQIGAHLNQ